MLSSLLETFELLRPIVLVLGMLLCPSANGAEIAVVGLHSMNTSAEEVGELTQQMVRIIQDSGTMDAIGPAALKDRLIGRQELILEEMANSDGIKKLEAGQLLYDRADMAQAILELKDAVELLGNSVAVTGETRSLRDAYLFLGLSHTGLGATEEAKRAFAKAVVMDPEMELDPLRYPPRVQEAFDQIRRRIRSAMNASITVQVPAGMEAEVWIDGRNRGTAPVTVDGLSPGRHYIRAVGPGAHRGYRTVGLSSTQELEVFLGMDQHGMGPVASSPQGRVQQTASLYRALGRHTGTELILIGWEDEVSGELLVQLYSPQSERFSKPHSAAWSSSLSEDNRKAALAEMMASAIDQSTPQGEIRSEAVDLRAQPLAINRNPVLTGLLLQNLRPAPAPTSGPAERSRGEGESSWLESYRWWLVGGGAAVVGGVTTAIVVQKMGDNGTITVGPIP